jgi:glutamyl-tRNA reductase
MNVQVVGCNHRSASVAVRERLAFGNNQAGDALRRWHATFPDVEAVLLSTCNRVELYAASETAPVPDRRGVADFLAAFHQLEVGEILPHLYHSAGEEALRHLFTVAASLDSMVLGESQILAQVKQAYQEAIQQETAGPLLHGAFQAATHVARRVAGETTIHQRHVSVPSVAVSDFARQIFERFDDKEVLVIGAGEMAEETLRYLYHEGAKRITVVNRRQEHAVELAAKWQGRTRPWQELEAALAAADLVISTTGAEHAVVGLEQFQRVERARGRRPLFVLDLAVPRDFEPAIGLREDVYLYSIDDLQQACQQNRAQRNRELPAATKIVADEAAQFMGELYSRAANPVIRQLKQGWQRPKEEELERLLNRLPELDQHSREEIRQSFDRLVNKLLHPPLESLRDESRHGIPHVLLDALARLFQLRQ